MKIPTNESIGTVARLLGNDMILGHGRLPLATFGKQHKRRLLLPKPKPCKCLDQFCTVLTKLDVGTPIDLVSTTSARMNLELP